MMRQSRTALLYAISLLLWLRFFGCLADDDEQPCTAAPELDPNPNLRTAVSWFAMADMPYGLHQRYCLNEQLRGMNFDSSSNTGAPSFSVHLGDIRRGVDDVTCPIELYQEIASMFSHPINSAGYSTEDHFFVIGDNEWTDCGNQDEAYGFWREHFGHNSSFGKFSGGTPTIERQTYEELKPGIDRSENFAFFRDDVLFVGLNLLSKIGNGIINKRRYFNQNFEWARDKLSYYSTRGMKAAVFFSHAYISSETLFGTNFTKPFLSLLREEYSSLPVLHIHGDRHKYCWRNLDPSNPNLFALTLDSGRKSPPMLISVVENTTSGTFQFSLDKRGGRYKPVGNCNQIEEDTWSPPPTVAPTMSTMTPTTVLPTMIPTPPPSTGMPTVSPTDSPAKSPTGSPTDSPTGSPTDSPTKSPTTSPTDSPTDSPTMSPTTLIPTTVPTIDEIVPPPQDTPAPTLARLTIVGKSPKKQPDVYPLEACQGDCDFDRECKDSLLCMKRLDREPVPGCKGLGRSGKDYCFTPPFNLLKTVGDDGKPSEKFPLGACQGDCDRDSECAPGLSCFKRKGYEAIAGCEGKGKSGRDYCYDPTL